MKLKKHSHTKLNKATKGIKQKGKTMKNLKDDDDFDMDEDEDTPSKPKKVNFSKEEEAYLVKKCFKLCEDNNSSVMTHAMLDAAAKGCNHRFHHDKLIRNGNALWWFIKRKKKNGDPLYDDVTIQGGSPKGPQGKQAPKAHKKPQQISTALKTETQQHSHSKTGNYPIEVLIKDPKTGNISKVIVCKFGSIEKLMFALA